MMKIFLGSRMICSAQSLNLIPDECYGSRPGCTALQVSLSRVLTADITRQSWAILVVASVDCCTCYDSVGHPPASIACQRLGVALSIMATIFLSIQEMNIFLHTAFGNSELAYNRVSSTGLPFQGVCQGNGMGPAIWLATSIPLIETLCCHSQLATFSCLISGTSVSLVGLIYMDDCDLFAYGSPSTTVDQVVAALQQNIRLWQGGLQSTGGSLSLKKCLWGLISHQHHGHRWLLQNKLSALASISILDVNRTSTPIHRLGPQEGWRSSG